MDTSTFQALAETLENSPPFKKECHATAALCSRLVSLGASEIWTARATSLGSLTPMGSWIATKTYDVAWTATPNSTGPSHVLQLKRPNSGAEPQQAVLFVADVALSAIDHLTCGPRTYSSLAYYHLPAGDYWSRLAAASSFHITLDPTSATNGNAHAEWIDPGSKLIAPKKRSVYNRIFGGGTNAKFSGLWRRPGKFEIDVIVHSVTKATHGFVGFTIADAKFEGAGDVRDWWP